MRLKVRMELETDANAFGDPGKAARFGRLAVVCCAGDEQAQPIRARICIGQPVTPYDG